MLAAIARGRADAEATGPKGRAALAAFEVAGVPGKLAPLIDDGRRGEAILEAMRMFTTGAEGNWQTFTDGIAGLRALGLESTARRATLESLILSPS